MNKLSLVNNFAMVKKFLNAKIDCTYNHLTRPKIWARHGFEEDTNLNRYRNLSEHILRWWWCFKSQAWKAHYQNVYVSYVLQVLFITTYLCTSSLSLGQTLLYIFIVFRQQSFKMYNVCPNLSHLPCQKEKFSQLTRNNLSVCCICSRYRSRFLLRTDHETKYVSKIQFRQNKFLIL